ncbi:MAG: NrfD/PsrC family molybdoenzyme membrane anchor subunit [Thermodesulfobacteriota bacterium]
MSAKNKKMQVWLGILGIAILAGLIAAFRLFTEGHGLFNTNDVIIWSLPLGVYIFLALSSSGLTILAAIPLVFGVKKYEPFAKRLVFLAIATLIGAFISIGLELGSIFHMIYIMLSPNLSSPIWWMGAIYSLEMLILILKFWKMHGGDWHSTFSKFLGTVSFICALIAPLMIGSVFGLTESRVTYFGPVMSIYSLLMAILSGLALFLVYSIVYAQVCGKVPSNAQAAIQDDFSRMFLYSLGIVAVFTIVKFTIEEATVIPEFLNYHKFEHAFGTLHVFHTEVILGLFLPLILMWIPSIRASSKGRIAAAGLALMGTLAMHMEILLAGQSRPIGPKAEQYPEIISYFPSVWEWLVFLFALAVMLLLYTLGERFFKLETVPE